jgi:hypothetical protein
MFPGLKRPELKRERISDLPISVAIPGFYRNTAVRITTRVPGSEAFSQKVSFMDQITKMIPKPKCVCTDV